MALESHVASAEDVLIGGLDFRMPSTGQYVVDKRMVTMQPQSGNYFSSQGLRLIRFTLAGTTDWLIPETLRLSFVVQNLDEDNPIQPVTIYPGSIFQRLRVLASGQALEDINCYARLQETLDVSWTPLGNSSWTPRRALGPLVARRWTTGWSQNPFQREASAVSRARCCLGF